MFGNGYTSSPGIKNTGIGGSTLTSLVTGNENTVLGYYAGRNIASGSGNVFIGANTGNTTDVSNKLFIDNSYTNDPLIKGDFSSREVKINSKLKVGGSGDAASATLQVDGNFVISGKKLETGNQDNYNLEGKSVLHFFGGGTFTLTGIANGVGGMIVHIIVNSNTNLILANHSPFSLNENKIVTGETNSDITISQGGGATLIYDSTNLKWIVIGWKN